MNWSDDRLDHFAEQVDKRFDDRVDRRLDRLDALPQSMIITLASILASFVAVVTATIF